MIHVSLIHVTKWNTFDKLLYFFVLICLKNGKFATFVFWKKVSEYDQEIPHSQTADYPVAPQGRAAKPSRDTRKTN